MDTVNMYGDMTQEEIELTYHHNGNYRGWVCVYTGCGYLMFEKYQPKYQVIRAYRGWEIQNWVYECWKECKEKIDALEDL